MRTLVCVFSLVASSVLGQGIQPMTPTAWEQARREGAQGRVPTNVPPVQRIDAAKDSGDARVMSAAVNEVSHAPFTFRVISPYVQAAEFAGDPAMAARMAQGPISPETMRVIVQVNPMGNPDAPLANPEQMMIQRGAQMYRPIDVHHDAYTVSYRGRQVAMRQGYFVFPVEAFVATQPITITIVGTGNVTMQWVMSIADLKMLK